MSSYEVRLKGGEVDVVTDADAYRQEGPLTTFFQTRPGRTVIDCWARPVASYRTADISRIRAEPDPEPEGVIEAWAS
ncbi:MAG: hypothetical protein M3N98_03810 [Actinomycetota bacterium]|nr:hypothetical protein [Actinomycetota bacterium]